MTTTPTPASPQSGPTLALDEPNTELGATRGDQDAILTIIKTWDGGFENSRAEWTLKALARFICAGLATPPKTPSQGREEIAAIIADAQCSAVARNAIKPDAIEVAYYTDLILAALSAPSQGSGWEQDDFQITMPNGDVLTRWGKYWNCIAPSGAVATNEEDWEIVENYGLDPLIRAVLLALSAPPSPEGVLKGKQGDRASSADIALTPKRSSTGTEEH